MTFIYKTCSNLLLCADDNERQDFNNEVIEFTLPAGEDIFDIELSDIINVDNVNEAAEQFILVLEITNATDIELDEHGGVLVLTILDDNREIVTIYFYMLLQILYWIICVTCRSNVTHT